MSRARCRNRAIDVSRTVHKSSHRRKDEGLSGQSFPWEVNIYAAGAIVERSGMVELRRPMRIFKIELFGNLGDPGQVRDCGQWVVPIDIEAGAPGICPCHRDVRRKPFEETLYTFPFPAHISSTIFAIPVFKTNRF